LSEEIDDQVESGQYQRLVGNLIYLTHTRLDISYVVSVVRRYMHDHRIPHQGAMYQILRYLKNFSGKGVLFCKNGHTKIEIYTDVDWTWCIDDKKSTSSYCAFVRGNLISWRSKKKKEYGTLEQQQVAVECREGIRRQRSFQRKLSIESYSPRCK
jgi:hypothetical protein